MKFKLNRKLYLTIFVFITVLVIIENPMFQPLNLVVQSSQLTVSNPNINSGLSFQGSCLFNTQINNVQATNTTSNQLVNAFQINITIFNFMSLILLISPIALYMYFISNNITIKSKKRIKKEIR
jgi:hypothetical protein